MEAGVEHVRGPVSEAEEHMTTNDGIAIEEMLRDAEEAVEPGDMAVGQVIGRGDMTQAPMTTSQLQSAGWVYVYNVQTGSESVINRNMLQQQLEKRHTDGSYLFSTQRPTNIPRPNANIKCTLHADGPDRAKYDGMGLIVCAKSNLLTETDRDTHVERRHPRAWATLKGEERRQEREDTRSERRAMMEILNAMSADRGRGND